MDFVWAVRYPLQGKRWYVRLLFLTFLLLIPYVGIVIGAGYMIAIIRSIAQDDYELPPVSFSRYLREGVEIVGNAVLHMLVGLLILVFLSLFTGSHKKVDVFLTGLLVLDVSLVTMHFFLGSLRYALTNDFTSMIQVKQNLRFLLQNRGQIIQAIINALLYTGSMAGIVILVFQGLIHLPDDEISGFLFIAVVMGVFMIVYIGMCVCGAGYLLGQLARRLDLTEPGEKRKNDKIKPSII